jgi:hypothetical protein
MKRYKTYAEELPQYDWRHDVDKGTYVEFVNVYGNKYRYFPHGTVDVVARDIKTLLRILTSSSLYATPFKPDGGKLEYVV